MYPRLMIDLKKIKNNLDKITEMVKKSGCSLMIVTKGYCADLEIYKLLEDSDIDELHSLGKQSTYFKQVYLDAEPGVLGKRCIEKFEIISESQVPKGNFSLIGGIDHGFNDPLAISWGFMDEKNKTLYITGEVYGRGMNLNMAADKMPRNVSYTGDSEDPRSNAQLKGYGVRISDAVKGPGSVFGGLMYLNVITIKVVDTCVNMIAGFQNYSWELDRISDQPTDKPNHAYSDMVDSVRYMIERYSRGRSVISGGKYKI